MGEVLWSWARPLGQWYPLQPGPTETQVPATFQLQSCRPCGQPHHIYFGNISSQMSVWGLSARRWLWGWFPSARCRKDVPAINSHPGCQWALSRVPVILRPLLRAWEVVEPGLGWAGLGQAGSPSCPTVQPEGSVRQGGRGSLGFHQRLSECRHASHPAPRTPTSLPCCPGGGVPGEGVLVGGGGWLGPSSLCCRCGLSLSFLRWKPAPTSQMLPR